MVFGSTCNSVATVEGSVETARSGSLLDGRLQSGGEYGGGGEEHRSIIVVMLTPPGTVFHALNSILSRRLYSKIKNKREETSPKPKEDGSNRPE